MQKNQTYSLLDNVREGFAVVADMSRHVTIHYDLLDDYVSMLPGFPTDNLLDPLHHFTGDAESTAAYILTLDTINFGSGYKAELLKEGCEFIDGSLYYTVATCLKNQFDGLGMYSPGALESMDAAEIATLLSLDINGTYSKEFTNMCASSLRELGALICRKYDGSFLKIIDEANGSVENMLALLLQMDNFRDVHRYRGMDIAFYKRGQIAAADLHMAFNGLKKNLFYDIGKLTMFADNAVPHVLRVDGVIEYSDELSSHIDSGEKISSGSEEEIEIRACSGHVVELLAKIKGLLPMNIDHMLWHLKHEEPRYKVSNPHNTLSHYY